MTPFLYWMQVVIVICVIASRWFEAAAAASMSTREPTGEASAPDSHPIDSSVAAGTQSALVAAGTPPVQLVVVSVNPPELAVHALRPAAYVLKPFSLAELEAAVAAALRRVEEGR